MAKALIAAVLLALLLVAAVVVPLAVMPSLFGFQDWPKAAQQAPREQVVSLSLPRAARTVRADPAPRATAAPPVATQGRLVAVAPRPGRRPPAVAPPAQPAAPTQPVAPAQPAAPAPPQAAPEAPPAAPIVGAREEPGSAPVAVEGRVQAGPGSDGMNKP